jgi:hypothetical protein
LSGEACVPNIGPAQRRLRARFGVVALVVALGVWAGAAALGLGSALRALLALPLLFGGFLGLIQAREKT